MILTLLLQLLKLYDTIHENHIPHPIIRINELFKLVRDNRFELVDFFLDLLPLPQAGGSQRISKSKLE